jgi:hypothetical protein
MKNLLLNKKTKRLIHFKHNAVLFITHKFSISLAHIYSENTKQTEPP